MNNRFIVRCSSAVGRSMAGVYLGGLTASGIIATWKPERARHFDIEQTAADVAARLSRDFSGTTWEAFHV